jgi:heme exporter protein D
MKEYFDMGGYGFFVWTSYAITLVAMVATVWFARSRHRQQLARIARRIKREQAGKQ